jgi:hypothetical protein
VANERGKKRGKLEKIDSKNRMETPEDLLQLFYSTLQSFSPSPPGAELSLALQRAGVKQIAPISQETFQRLLQNKPEIRKLLHNTNSSDSTLVGGGDFAEKIAGLALLIAFFTLYTFASLRVTRWAEPEYERNWDPPYEMYKNPKAEEKPLGEDLFTSVMAACALLLFFKVIFSAHGGSLELNNYDKKTDINQAKLVDFLGQVLATVENQIEKLADPQRFSILHLPSSGKLVLKRTKNNGKPLIDPITFRDLQTGDKVAIVKNNTKSPMLVTSLQAWIYYPFRTGLLTNPVTKEELKKEDIKVYTLNLTETNLTLGGKRKKSKSRKAKRSKKSTRKQ